MLATITFGVSLAGLIALLSFKTWELRRAPSAYRRTRAHADKLVVQLSNIFVGSMPRLAAWFRSVIHVIVVDISIFFLKAVRFLERKLGTFVDMVRGHGEVNFKKGSSSLFLRNVREHRDEVRRKNGYH